MPISLIYLIIALLWVEYHLISVTLMIIMLLVIVNLLNGKVKNVILYRWTGRKGAVFIRMKSMQIGLAHQHLLKVQLIIMSSGVSVDVSILGGNKGSIPLIEQTNTNVMIEHTENKHRLLFVASGENTDVTLEQIRKIAIEKGAISVIVPVNKEIEEEDLRFIYSRNVNRNTQSDIGCILPRENIKIAIIDTAIDWELLKRTNSDYSDISPNVILSQTAYDAFNEALEPECKRNNRYIFTSTPRFDEPTLIGTVGIRPHNRTRKQIKNRRKAKLIKKRLL